MYEVEDKNIATVDKENPIGKFLKSGKFHFDLNIKGEFDYINSIKESIKILSFDVPNELKEIFIPYSNAPVFFIYDSWLLSQIEEYMKLHFVRAKYLELHKSIKENYTKWVTSKNRNEKEYFANLTINFIERDVYKHNFFKVLIEAILYTYHAPFFNPSKALELFRNAHDLISASRMSDNVKNEINYIIKLFVGFLALKESDYQIANIAFKEALDAKKIGGITAKFYLAITEVHNEQIDVCEYYLKEVLDYDFHRLSISIAANNNGMLGYFLKNAFFYNVYYEKEFAHVLNIIESLLHSYRREDGNILKTIESNTENLKKKEIENIVNDEISNSIMFMEKIVQNYSSSENTFILGLGDVFAKKYDSIFDSIVKNKRNKLYGEIMQSMISFEDIIKENIDAKNHLQVDLENFRTKHSDNRRKKLNELDDETNYNINYLEERANNITEIDRYNPQKTMSVNMTYNIIIALVVFLIGGFSSYSNRMISNPNEYNSVLGMILFEGAKWGIISFFIGLLISIIISGLVMIERADEKQKITRKIIALKNQKGRKIQEITSEFEIKEKLMSDNFNSSISVYNQKIEDLSKEKENKKKILGDEAEKLIQEFIDYLRK
ncbi:MAG: hypothetical protein WC055_05040 [Melioribacteraceae bacterium]